MFSEYSFCLTELFRKNVILFLLFKKLKHSSFYKSSNTDNQGPEKMIKPLLSKVAFLI